MAYNVLDDLLNALREANREQSDVGAVVRASAQRMASDASYRAALREAIQALLRATTTTHFLTESGIVSDETILSGTLRRLGSRLAPAPPRSAPLEHALLTELLSRADGALFDQIGLDDARVWTEALLHDSEEWDDRSELASALVILATRVAGAGMDARLSERMPSLEAWNSPFLELSRAIDDFAEAYVSQQGADAACRAAFEVLDRCIEQVVAFRAAKQALGTTLHLSSSSLRMLQQLHRLRLLIECTIESERPRAAASLGLTLVRDLCQPRPTLHFVAQKLELIAFLVVGHAARKGANYAVQTASEYLGFWFKSILGGCLVAIFASFKIHLSHEGLAPVPQAFLYGLNYAVCFVLIYVLGATLATKQPALTASRLAESLEEGPDHESFAELVRAIWSSQFVSFLGNILGAALFAALFALLFAKLTGSNLTSREEGLYLYDKMHPIASGTLFYAAIAGVMLSVAGFFAGFVDNAVVFHRLGERVQAGAGVFRRLGPKMRARLGGRIEKSAGAISGNVLLGFMLGSAGSIGVILGIPFDIRHIAFASSHGTLALLSAPELVTLGHIAVVLLAVSVIGFVNFVVSFSLTLSVAVNARRLEGIDWRSQMRAVARLVRANPLGFVLPIGWRRGRRAGVD